MEAKTMGTIVLKSGKKTQEFSRGDGKKLVLTVDIGDTDVYADWLDKSKELQALTIGEDSESLRKIKPIMKELAIMLFGRMKWGKILSFCEGNIFAVGTIITTFSGLIESAIKENAVK
jgi:hypothetical protein